MTYIKINDTMYPAAISGNRKDGQWDGRESKTITLEMDYATALALFVDGLLWSIVMDVEKAHDDGSVTTEQEEYDNSEYDMAGSITDHRDGTLSVKMGKPTAEELLAVITGEVQ